MEISIDMSEDEKKYITKGINETQLQICLKHFGPERVSVLNRSQTSLYFQT